VTAPSPSRASLMCSSTPPAAKPGSDTGHRTPDPGPGRRCPGWGCGDGRREVFGFDVGGSENGIFWTGFLRSLGIQGLME